MADDELRDGGQQFRMQFLGYIPIETSMRTLPNEICNRIVRECIRLVSLAAGEDETMPEDVVARKLIGSSSPTVSRHTVDVSFSTRAVVAAHADESESDVFGLTVHAHPISEVFFKYFGYIWRHADKRECYVYKAHDAALSQSTLSTIFRLNYEDQTLYEPKPYQNDFNEHSQSSSEFLQSQIRELTGQLYFHGPLSRSSAEFLLTSEGNFLLRLNTDGHVVLSGRNAHSFVHVVLKTPQELRTVRDFSSIVDLVTFHVQSLEPVRASGDERLILRRFVNKSS